VVVLSLSNLLYPTATANTAPNPIEIISITESSNTSVEFLFNSNLPKKQLSYYVINAAIELPVAAPQSSKTQNVAAIAPKSVKKVIKTKATGLITAEIKNLNPKVAYKFSVLAKTNKGKMISSAAVEYSPISNLIDAISNLPADWGNPKPIQLPTPAPTTPPIAIPAFTLSSATETRTVNTAATGFTINSTGGAIASFAINATPPGMSFNTTTGALTGTPNTVAAATNYTITATNASGNATQTFTLTVAIAAPAFTLSSATETRTVNTAATGFTINSTGGAIASFAINATPPGMSFNTTTGALTGTPNTVAAATNYTITATNASGNATQTFTLTVTSVVYTVGQTGPGGGKVFYVAPTGTTFACGPTLATTCTYLEVAPRGWSGAADDPVRRWANTANENSMFGFYPDGRIMDPTNHEIGGGYDNTRKIIDQGNNDPTTIAAALADSHTSTVSGVVYDDWYLPSQKELNQMCKWQKGETAARSSAQITDLDFVCDRGFPDLIINSAVLGAQDAGFRTGSDAQTAGAFWTSNYGGTGIGKAIDWLVGGYVEHPKSRNGQVRPIRAFP
jgi:hypothetical protein